MARRIETKTWSLKTVKKKTAEKLQLAIRLEASIYVGQVPAVVRGKIQQVFSPWEHCVCVTCGEVRHYKHCQGGHFLKGRTNNILLREKGINPQCVHCNKELGGNEAMYRIWMEHVHGPGEIAIWDKRWSGKSNSFDREDLLSKRDEYMARIKRAKEILREGWPSPNCPSCGSRQIRWSGKIGARDLECLACGHVWDGDPVDSGEMKRDE